MKVRRHRQGERFFIAGFFQEMVEIVTRNLLKKTSLWAGEPQNEGKKMPQEGRRAILGVNSYF